jgi:N-acetyl sugar amidotransferase
VKIKEQISDTFFGLPEEVVFCKKCVMSNQRPTSAVEFRHTPKSSKTTMHIDSEGICDACRNAEKKTQINWQKREEELLKLLDKYRKSDGNYDCLVPGSGGKDSAYQSHILKYKYGMNPLTVTWPPILYTDYGYKNWKNWVDSGFDNISFNRNGNVMKLLTKLSIQNLLHPFQTFILGQKNLAPKIAALYDIPLIFYGENEAEYGNPIADNNSSLRSKSYFSYDNINDIYLGGVSVGELFEKYKLKFQDIKPFLPIEESILKEKEINIHYLGYYLKWTPQEVYYYAIENTDFKARPFRSQGTYSKYNSIDDKIDDLHYYTTFIKFGIGRATYDASQEIRNNHINRDEGKALVRRFDGEFPDKYFDEVMDYLNIKPEEFHKLCDLYRSPHLWSKNSNGEWVLRHSVNGDGYDD